MSRKHIIIVQRRLTHYRVPLFSTLRSHLAQEGMELVLLQGMGTEEEETKNDGAELDFAQRLPTRYLAGGRICWQPFGKYLNGAALAIVTQENRLLYNFWLQWRPRRFKLAFWGHGRNFQAGQRPGLRERIKAAASTRVDWWFAYTDLTADLLRIRGFPEERITVLNNAIDTGALAESRNAVTPADVQRLRHELGIGNSPTGIFIGSLYAGKRLDFLIESAERIRARIPDFHLVIVGDGPERRAGEQRAKAYNWIHWAGTRFGHDKALYAGLGDVLLNPGLVGLVILDAFVLGLPLITTDCGLHGPEIAYLKHGVNGMMLPNDIDRYAAGVASALADTPLLDRLRRGCQVSAREYTLEGMAGRFLDGIRRAVELSR
jgi:glycosyltransferase involved in cell wall biosynthesis